MFGVGEVSFDTTILRPLISISGMQVEFVDPIFDFCKSMAKLGLDEAEYALLVAINTFSTGEFLF